MLAAQKVKRSLRSNGKNAKDSVEKLNSISLSRVSETSQTEYVSRLQNLKKEILNISRPKFHALSNMQNWRAYFTLLF